MAGGVTIVQIYKQLISEGASTIEAIGIMANMINESGFNPEAVGDQGSSFGLVQQHGNYGYLVTGNPVADMQRQISTLKSLGGFGAASGSTPAAAAGNFAANYERCVGCQPGGAQYNSRVANAAKVAGWVKSGKWPTSAGSGGGGGGAGGTPAPATLTGAQLTAAYGAGGVPWSDIVDPFQAFQDAAKAIAQALTGGGGSGILGAVQSLATSFGALANMAGAILHDVEWLFVPSHWVRVFAFLFGAGVLLPGLYALMHTGTGDMYLAMGILLTTAAGILLFIAFHNLPDDVKNLSQLLAWISASVREGKPAASATG